MKKVLIIFTLVFVSTVLKSQTVENTEPYMYIGGYAGINYNIHSADFNELPGAVSCCPQFDKGKGLGFNLGALLRFPLATDNSITFKVGYITLDGKLEKEEMIGNTEIRNTTPPYETSEIVKAFSNHSVDSKFGAFTIEPNYNWQFYDNFRLNAGFLIGFLTSATFSSKEQLTSPEGIVFKDSETRTRNQFDNVTLQDKNSFQFYGKLALSYSIKFGKNMNIVPEIGYSLPFTYVYASKWKVTPVNFSLALEYPLTHSFEKDTIKEIQYFRDTTIIAQYGINKEAVNLLSKFSKVDVKETNDNFIATTKIYEKYEKVVPKSSKMNGTLKIVGVDNNGNLQNNPTIIIEEIEVTESFPLLPYIFFKENSADINQTPMILKSDASNKEFSYKDLTWETLEIYSNLLNILKERMDKNPNSKIKITGTNSNTSFETNNLTISKARAENVKNYLVDKLKISPSRIEVSYQNLPDKPSNPTVADGIQENQRAEISSNNFELLSPVILGQIEKVSNPPIINITPEIESELAIKEWKVKVSQDNKTIREYTGKGTLSKLQWIVGEEPIPQLETPIEVKFTAIDSLGNEFNLNKNLSISQKTIKKKREEIKNDTVYQRYSLIVFDFDKSELTSAHKLILDSIKDKIKSNSIVSIYGYADRTGTPQYNKDLAARRIDEVVKYLKLKPENTRKYPIGSDELLYDNDLPQGRSYSRTVRIIVATPIK
ncbi:MAG: OmpA family protein [Candidatus Kapaibacteriota bacterium]